jgi:hypothetical protein
MIKNTKKKITRYYNLKNIKFNLFFFFLSLLFENILMLILNKKFNRFIFNFEIKRNKK